jgi:hypothetical protein
MSKLITNNLRLFNVDQFIESFSEPNFNIYYYFIGNPLPFPSDNAPPTLYDNVKTTFLDPYDNMIAGKRITSSDVIQMALRHDWVTGTRFAKYSHDDTGLFSKAFFTAVDEGSSYSVFKCLDNNGGALSTDAPLSTETSANDDFYFTSDGYQWKYMYTISQSTFDKFATSSHIPVILNANVVANAVSGSIDNIELINSGNGYSSYCNGNIQEARVGGNPLIFAIDPATASANANFYINCALKITAGPGSGQQRVITGYTVAGSTRRVVVDTSFSTAPTTASSYEITPLVTITGDGTGATARAIVNSTSNTIHKIEIVTRGSDYSYASVTVTGNTGIINVSTGTAITANTATAKVIISPKGGHGSNAAAELGARYVGISTTFDSTLSGGKIVDKNEIRSVGIIKDPLFSNAVLDVSSATGTFTDGETVEQSQSNGNFTASGIVYAANDSVVKLTNVYGFFLTGNSTVNTLEGVTSGFTAVCDSSSQPTTYFDQTYKVVGTLTTQDGFIEDELVTQAGTDGNGYFYSSNATVVRLVGKKGTFNQSDLVTTYSIEGSNSGAVFNVSGVVDSDVVHSSGDVIYIENFTPLSKNTGQTETIKLILEF